MINHIFQFLETIFGFCMFCNKYTGKRLYNCCQENIEHINRDIPYKIYCPFSYGNPLVRSLILQFKYSYNFNAGYFLCKQISNLIKLDNIIYVPIPLNKKRLIFRGYNQSYVMCQYLQGFIGGEIVDCLTRQSLDHKNDRLTKSFEINLKCKPHFPINSNVIIVDDVIASGNTIMRAAQLLDYENILLCSMAIT